MLVSKIILVLYDLSSIYYAWKTDDITSYLHVLEQWKSGERDNPLKN